MFFFFFILLTVKFLTVSVLYNVSSTKLMFADDCRKPNKFFLLHVHHIITLLMSRKSFYMQDHHTKNNLFRTLFDIAYPSVKLLSACVVCLFVSTVSSSIFWALWLPVILYFSGHRKKKTICQPWTAAAHDKLLSDALCFQTVSTLLSTSPRSKLFVLPSPLWYMITRCCLHL